MNDTITLAATAPRKRRGEPIDQDARHLDPLPDDDLIALICRVGNHYGFRGDEYRSAFFAAARTPDAARRAYSDMHRQIFGRESISKEATRHE